MDSREIELTFDEVGEGDVPELTEVMTRAFDDDAQKHLGMERGGPEGYDNGEFFRKWLFGYQESAGYKASSSGQVVGGMIVWILPGGDNILGTIFVDPAYQDMGVGTRFWQFVEERYPDTRSWRLATPAWAIKNHYFYVTKCGFNRVDTDPILGSPEGELVYRKEMERGRGLRRSGAN
ncbi:MAG: GNAT family N-acetyltransferase [Anaerolineae bacterium]|jgi:GNAT superfamily N-acetyltransferase